MSMTGETWHIRHEDDSEEDIYIIEDDGDCIRYIINGRCGIPGRLKKDSIEFMEQLR